MYKHVIFDFNGTILNDVALCHNLLNEILIMQDTKPISRLRYKQVFTFPIIDYYRRAGVDFDKNSYDELAMKFIEKYQPASMNLKLFPKTIETFEYLNQKGYSLYILSASETNNLRAQTDNYKISKYFKAILGLDNIKAESKVQIAKDYLDSYSIDSKDVLFIGDTLHDLDVAKSINVDCFLVSSGHQAKSVIKEGNVRIIKSIKELKRIL